MSGERNPQRLQVAARYGWSHSSGGKACPTCCRERFWIRSHCSSASADCGVAGVVDNEVRSAHRDQCCQCDYVAAFEAVFYEARGSYAEAETARLQRHRHVIRAAQGSHKDGILKNVAGLVRRLGRAQKPCGRALRAELALRWAAEGQPNAGEGGLPEPF